LLYLFYLFIILAHSAITNCQTVTLNVPLVIFTYLSYLFYLFTLFILLIYLSHNDVTHGWIVKYRCLAPYSWKLKDLIK